VTLAELGWTDTLAAAFEPYAAEGLSPARVAVEYTHVYRVYAEAGSPLAEIAGRIRHQARGRQDYPAVGDWVALQHRSGDERGTIHAVLPRRSAFSRKLAGETTEAQVVAANIDIVFLLSGLDRDFNLRRIERYLILARESGAEPVILLNKADLVPDAAARRAEVKRIAPGLRIHVISSRTGSGLDRLAPYLETGRTVALLGSSGTGKSTLINRLIGQDLLPTADVRAKDSRGRHTSRHRELVVLPQGGVLIDTPGMRELQLWDVRGGIEQTFEDIEALAGGCRFRDCRHRDEPGCAVKAAAAEGRLPPARLENYHKVQEEIRELEGRQEQRAQAEQKRRWKTIHKGPKRHKPREP
jgi:ribosome biogenesis GTPase / thiamine phosphate phosphatase